VRSTPARALREGQLVVDRYAVSKIGKIDYLPLNTITVQLINQLTGDEAERNLRWDQQVTTEEPFEVEIGDTGKIRVELAQLSDEEGRPAYRYRVTDETAGIDYEATDLRARREQSTRQCNRSKGPTPVFRSNERKFHGRPRIGS
jgi:hypothetical protein